MKGTRSGRLFLCCWACLLASRALGAPQPPEAAGELEKKLEAATPDRRLLILMQLSEAEESVSARKRVDFAQQAVSSGPPAPQA